MMNPIHTAAELKAAIAALEIQQAEDVNQLKSQLLHTYDYIQPINLIKRTFREASGSRELKNQMITSSIGMALGYLSKTLYVGKSSNPVKNMVGAAIMFGVSDAISNNPKMMGTVGQGILRWIVGSRKAESPLLPEPADTSGHV